MIMCVGMTNQTQEEIKEEQAREEVEVEQQGTDLHLGGVHGGGGELVDGHWDVDGDDHEAIQSREGAGEREQGGLGS